MSLSRWSRRVLPFWTFMLGTLVGSLPGGLTRASSYRPLLLYVATTGALWVPLEIYARRRDRESRALNRVHVVTDANGSTRGAL